MADNTVTLAGNVTRNPELRYTPSDRAVANFGLAVNRRYQVNDEWTESTSFYEVVAWGDLGRNVAESLTKGNRVVVTGRLEQRSWETDNGETRSKHEVVADDIGASLRWATTKITKVVRDTAPATPPDDEAAGDEEPF